MTCPHCGGPPAPLLVYKHRWWVCATCGNATSELRPDQPADRLPSWLAARLPPLLRVNPDAVADPARQWFVPERYPTASAAGTPYQGEAEKVRRLLDHHGIAADGAVLDLSGGPGFVAQSLTTTAGRVVMTDFVPHVVAFARARLGVDARHYDYQGAPLPTVVEGPFDLILSRYSLNFCRDLPAFTRQLNAVAAPDAVLMVAGVISTSRGACLTSAVEDAPPLVLWNPSWFERVFAAAGWQVEARFETDPPMCCWAPRGPWYALFSLPWALRPGPLPPGVRQRQPGFAFRRGRR